MGNCQGISKKIISCLNSCNKILICGNGGSASQSNHFAGELVGKYKFKRKALPAISLSANSSILTSIANDYSFDKVFSRQIEALGSCGDILIVLSTSGKSKNCLEAIKTAKKMCIDVIDFPRIGKDTPSVQEYQVKLMHQVCERVEKAFL